MLSAGLFKKAKQKAEICLMNEEIDWNVLREKGTSFPHAHVGHALSFQKETTLPSSNDKFFNSTVFSGSESTFLDQVPSVTWAFISINVLSCLNEALRNMNIIDLFVWTIIIRYIIYQIHAQMGSRYNPLCWVLSRTLWKGSMWTFIKKF